MSFVIAWEASRHDDFDEQSLKMNGGVAIKRTLSERLTGPLVVLASVVAGVVVLYLVGSWLE
jgi:hypothetical protein